MQVKKASEATGMYMTVVVGGETYQELERKEAHDIAKAFAQSQGFNPRGLSNNPTIYPVNEQGEATEKVAIGLEKLAGFEKEFRFCNWS